MNELERQLEGSIQSDPLARSLYATDASVYRHPPLAVAFPKSEQDIRRLVRFADREGFSLIPRAAGTSLAGQCVGEGIVVDVSRHMTRILEFSPEEQWIKVQPGIIRDELNTFLQPHGLFFGPNTSTSNRCMIGGMVGNNSCGSTSIVYGSTRDHVLELEVILSNGDRAVFKNQSSNELQQIQSGNRFENQIYQQIIQELQPTTVQRQIREAYPRPEIHRRNTGYAIDLLIEQQPFHPEGSPLNLCTLLAGSEGTLAFTTAIKLHLDPLPEPHEVVVAAHFSSVRASLLATVIAMKAQPSVCELMDHFILDATKNNRRQRQNRFFVEGEPAAILCVAFRGNTPEVAKSKAEQLIQQLKTQNLGTAFPLVFPPDTKRVWELRKAGLGVLFNRPGDQKPVACIEDTAVRVEDLPQYIEDFEQILQRHGQKAVFYAHAGAGELHLRPYLNLKDPADRAAFRAISTETAQLVKKYRGSLSGEHGDGRVRAEFLPLMIGEANYALLQRIKQIWDPKGIFNPGKIVDAPPMDESLRYKSNQPTPTFDTAFDFSQTQGLLRAAEQCNGSGDCRKLPEAGGTMCPSYQATRNEKDSTRGRANALREFLTWHRGGKKNPFDHPELKEVMDLCISCKGCTSECPSNVDMASLKAEFLYQYHKSHRPSLSDWTFANIGRINHFAARIAPRLTRFVLGGKWSSPFIKRILRVAPQRRLPLPAIQTLTRWYKKEYPRLKPIQPHKTIWLLCDEFLNTLDVSIGIQSIQLLTGLGYHVRLSRPVDSGRTYISKGFLKQAARLSEKNVHYFSSILSEEQPLIGIEPSAILTFRDELERLVPPSLKDDARAIAGHSFLMEEFLAQEATAGHITPEHFDEHPRHILLHGHCHQKALSSVDPTAFILSLPKGHTVNVIPSGCCGMAGSFGYEKDHMEVSMQIGELVLFPAIRGSNPNALIVAPGTSCRHQIMDGTGREGLHPIEVLNGAVKS